MIGHGATMPSLPRLKITCGCKITLMPWRLLRKRARYRRLGEIAVRLRCERCGNPPASLALYWQGGRDQREMVQEIRG